MNWVCLKALNEIYLTGRTRRKPTLIKDPDIRHLLYATRELGEAGKFLVERNGFKQYYDAYHLKNFQLYSGFLERNNLLKPQTKFIEGDIQILIDLEERMTSGEIASLREQIIKSNETVRGVSLMFFRNEKYLLKQTVLLEAVKQILKIDKLADDRDQQYKYVLECHDPKIIVLCENVDFLKRPTQVRQYNIELWYAGGKNIDKLKYADTHGLPIFYLCDWDYDGLLTFGAVKGKIPSISLLFPNGPMKNIDVTEHKSRWRFSEEPAKISGLDSTLFTQVEKSLIESLVSVNAWIIEESNDLITMAKPFLK